MHQLPLKFSTRLLGFAILASISWTPSLALSDNVVSPKVVGGDPVPTDKYSFMVALQGVDYKRVGNPYGHFCGGVLISSQKVLTAAHCVSERELDGTLTIESTEGMTAIAGMTTYGQGQGQKRSVTNILVYPQYSMPGLATNAYDVAILTLDSPVVNLPVVELANSKQDQTGVKATVAGWGATHYGDPTVPVGMLGGSVKVTPSKSCIRDNANHGNVVDSALQICGESRPVDTCQGDSGGPLFREIDGTFYQLGIVSWGIGCGKIDAVYSRISNPEITRFIQQNR